MHKPLTISLVIPVYNEESHLAACLEAALSQDRPFDEIIVVDNNSTDATAAIARQFPDVVVLRETRQGVVFARNRGFNAANGDIIARIDADTHLSTSWSQQIADNFADSSIDAVSGAITYHDIAASTLVNQIDLQIRTWLASKLEQRMFLLGANMAIRRRSWRKVRAGLCSGAVHEDLDLASHLAEVGANVVFMPELIAGVSGRRADTDIVSFIRYVRSLPRSYAVHGGHEHRYMYPVTAFVLFNYLPLRVLYRGYDSRQQLFRMAQLFALHEQRVSPISLIK